MRLIKKIAAIMFAFMMVVSMSCNVKADDTTTPATGDGTITINNAIPGQTYKLYRLLDLESYSVNEDGQKENGNYSYKPTSKWKTFLEGNGIRDVYFTFENGYASWKKGANVEAFAKLAIEHANKENAVIEAEKTEVASAAIEGNNTSTVTFKNLPLGYYLVDSSVGTLCSLDTTNKDATIQEKNGVPSVDKKVSNSKTGPFDTSSTASIGDTVYFKTTITAQPGAQNYVLHDKMTEGLTFDQNSVNVSLHKNAQNTDRDLSKTTDYSVETTNLESTDPKCTFHVNFIPTFCDSLEANDTITVTYSAVLNGKAEIGNVDKNTNETWLKYGDSQSTQHKPTTTKTFEMKVFKFYKDKNDSNTEKGLAGATFKLTKGSKDAENISFVKTSNKTATNDVYRVAKKGEAGTVTTITSPNSGEFTIQGLGAGTYYLTETKQPDGYNKLSGPVTVVIDKDGKVKVKNGDAYDEVTQVKVENKTGTVLPSTGGMRTTMIYLIGGALVLGSGVVLATKRRVKKK